MSRVAVLFAGLLMACGGAVVCEDTPTDADIAQLIRRLGSESYEDRAAAAKALDRIGPLALPQIVEAARGNTDPEVRRAATVIQQDIRSRRLAAEQFEELVSIVTKPMGEHGLCKIPAGELRAIIVNELYTHEGLPIPPPLARIANKDETWLIAAYAALGDHRLLDPEGDWEKSSSTMLAKVDPHARLIRPKDFKPASRLPDTLGIDLELDRLAETKQLRVASIRIHGPAYKAGMRVGDYIEAVTIRNPQNDFDLFLEAVTFDGKVATPDEIAAAILLPGTSSASFVVRRTGTSQLVLFEVKPGPAPSESVLGVRRTEADEWTYWLDERNRIAYVRLPSFEAPEEDVLAVVERLERAGMKALVVDLRFNSEGALWTSVQLAARFVPDRCLGTFVFRANYTWEVPDELWDERAAMVPVICLVNRESANASELFAAALQDHKRATIVGERTAGRVGTQIDLPYLQPFGRHSLCITDSVLLRPDGRKLDRMKIPGHPDDEWGVTPDDGLRIDLTDRERAELAAHLKRTAALYPPGQRPASDFKDRQLEAALARLRADLDKGRR
jgi:carboxyl-terminal processing protease